MTSADFTNKNNPECYAYTKFGENVTFTRGVLNKTKTKVTQHSKLCLNDTVLFYWQSFCPETRFCSMIDSLI